MNRQRGSPSLLASGQPGIDPSISVGHFEHPRRMLHGESVFPEARASMLSGAAYFFDRVETLRIDALDDSS